MLHTISGIRVAILLVLLLPQFIKASGNDLSERYARMLSAFEKGAFRECQLLGDELIKDNHLSPELFQLMGHVRYRQGDLGRAALWYLRAALFPPPSAEIRQNLGDIHTVTGNFMYPTDNLRQQVSAWLARWQWLMVAVAGTWVLIAGTILGFFFLPRLRTLLMTAAALGLVAAVLGGLGWLWHPSYEKLKDIYVVTLPKAAARTAAAVTSGLVVDVRPGSQVRVIEDRGSWCYVEIPTGKDNESNRGWLQKDTMTPLWPFDRSYLE